MAPKRHDWPIKPCKQCGAPIERKHRKQIAPPVELRNQQFCSRECWLAYKYGPQRSIERFWAGVSKTESCWLWTKSVATGYGVFVFLGKRYPAHRFAYEMAKGPIPEGLQLDHLCRTPLCVNPDHLEPVTPSQNVRRGVGPAAKNAVRTHCVHGHEFTPENTYINQGKRSCRICRAAKMAAHYAKRRLK